MDHSTVFFYTKGSDIIKKDNLQFSIYEIISFILIQNQINKFDWNQLLQKADDNQLKDLSDIASHLNFSFTNSNKGDLRNIMKDSFAVRQFFESIFNKQNKKYKIFKGDD